MRIRLASANDIEGIAEVHVASWQTTYSGMISDAVLARLNVSRRVQMWTQIFEQGLAESVIFVLEDEHGKIQGFCHGGKNRSPELGHEAELYAFYLLKEVQGRGYGRQLFDHFVSALKTWGYASFIVWVIEKNPSLQIYQKFGGQPVASQKIQIGEDLITKVALAWGKPGKASLRYDHEQGATNDAD